MCGLINTGKYCLQDLKAITVRHHHNISVHKVSLCQVYAIFHPLCHCRDALHTKCSVQGVDGVLLPYPFIIRRRLELQVTKSTFSEIWL